MRRRGFSPIAKGLAALLVIGATLLAGEYRLIKKIPVAGDYGWDYLTAGSDARRLYVSHEREVVVLDLDSGALIGKIPGKSVHGIAIAKDFGAGSSVAAIPVRS